MKKILYFITVLTISVFILTACRKNNATVYFASENSQTAYETVVPENDTELSGTIEDESKKAQEVVVYVCGEVVNSGVYRLPEHSRVCDAIEYAGGMTENAGKDFWNLAAEIYDGQMIYVPTKEEAADGNLPETAMQPKESSAGETSKININTATAEELMTLTGIGKSKAENIVEYRQENGNFSSIEDITNVSGIGESIFNKIKENITV